LVHRRYLDVFIRRHIQEWLRFVTHLDRQELGVPADSRGPDVQQYVASRAPHGSPSFIRFLYSSIRIFLETDAEGHFRRRRAEGILPPAPDWIVGATSRYLDFLGLHRAVSQKTLSKRRFQLHTFGHFLDAVGLTDFGALRFRHLDDFCLQLHGRSHRTRLSYGVTLRGFARWAYGEGLVPFDLAAGTLTVRQYRDTQIPDVLSAKEVDRLLATVDRSTVMGRRDHAVLLLAARYGMRASDIRGLQLDHLDWRQRRIVFPQSKTGRVLALPLLEDVGDALLTYLQHGRPSTADRHVFIRHRAPYEPFGPNNNLPTIMAQALARAGLTDRAGSRGLYLLRRTCATQLLAAGTPLKTIGDILGHVNQASTRIYTKVDVPALRTVAVSEAEVLQ
jgi:site-specific recombinase XerD